MTPQQINEAIAKACGWVKGYWHDSAFEYMWKDANGKGWSSCPNYYGSLDAMNQAETMCIRSLSQDLKYTDTLRMIASKAYSIYTETRAMVSASASIRAEAFLRTLNLWQPTPESK